MKRFPTTAMVLSLFAAPLTLFACSSDSASDTTLAAKTTVESVVSTSGAADTTTAADTTGAADTAAATAADTTVGATETTAANGTAAATGPLTGAQVKTAFSAMGLPSTDAEVACVQAKAGTNIDLKAAEPPPGFIKALMVCAPDAMAKAAAGSVDADLAKAGVTTAMATCFMKSTFTVVGAKDLDQVQKLFALASLKDFPQDVKAEILSKAKSCGLNDTQMAALMAS